MRVGGSKCLSVPLYWCRDSTKKKEKHLTRFKHFAVMAAGIAAGLTPLAACGADVVARWSFTANGFAGSRGDAITLTWGIVPDGTPISASGSGESNNPSSLAAMMDGIFGDPPGGSDLTQRRWFYLFNDSMDRISQIAGLTYVYEPNDDGRDFSTFARGQLGVRPDVRIGGHNVNGVGGAKAYGYFPNIGDIVFDTADIGFFSNQTKGRGQLRNMFMHEHSHGLGLHHSTSNSFDPLMEPVVPRTGTGPQFDDILGLQRLYGDVLEKNGGNDTAPTATPLGTLTLGSALTRGADAADVTVGLTDTDFVSIDGSSDVDYFSFTLDRPAFVDFSIAPIGPTYHIDPASGPAYTLTASRQSDLHFILLDQAQSLIQVVDQGGLGSVETLTDLKLNAGTYYLAVGGLEDATQFYRMDLSASKLPADINNDGVVDLADFGVLAFNFGLGTTPAQGNLDGDSDIDPDDFALFAADYPTPANSDLAQGVPEPASIWGMVVLAGLIARRGRRRA